jgi:anthranilate phosphoribosyltransferase
MNSPQSNTEMTIKDVLAPLMERKHLTADQASFVMDEMLNGRLEDAQISAFITLLRSKTETAEELAALVKTMWANMPDVSGLDVENAIDTCGTGGDLSGTFNISTAVALLLAAAGEKVAKHGNKAATSLSGAADVLEALDIPVGLNPEQCKQLFVQTGFAFLFAPTFHAGMRFAAPVRASVGVRTTFNFLGPLANPFHAPIRMHGVSDESIVEIYAQTLKELGVKRAYVFHGHGGLDEISLSGITDGFLLLNGEITKKAIDPSELGFSVAMVEDLAGGDAQHNASIIHRIAAGESGPKRDIVVLNAAVAYDLIHGAGLSDAIVSVANALDSGAMTEKISEISSAAKALVTS